MSDQDAEKSVDQVRRGINHFFKNNIERAGRLRHPAADWHNHKEE